MPKSPYHTIKDRLQKAYKHLESANQCFTDAERVYNECAESEQAVAMTGFRLLMGETMEAMNDFIDMM